MNLADIKIIKGIVHILDAGTGLPVLSDRKLDITPDLDEFFSKLIFKLMSGDELKKCSFENVESSTVCSLVKTCTDENFIEVSKTIAQKLYDIMNSNASIPSADLAVIIFELKDRKYMALLKLNYKESYVHMIKDEDGVNYNRIIHYHSTLPADSAHLSEAVIIDTEDLEVQLVEKKYEIEGAKKNYLSEDFMECQSHLSSKTKLDIVTKAVEQINKKHFAQEPEKQIESKKIIKKEIEDKGSINVSQISEKMYADKPQIKEEFDKKMEKYHMDRAVVEPQSEKTLKKFEKHLIKTDTGIEINIPEDQFKDSEKVEFISNEDGTVSVLIKNINSLLTK